ncbi:MAG: hypothetical protein F4226_02930 [Synechococcus sp. SB0678_bin_12]|nr:hypothetical protein [Synechococcus sp. SB0667_bin_8]MYF35765.1 hypothetical protein [Synechococcus sp. SB0678_bin_12]MYG64218.1 hypothetical protein [Synechococcus sp. SB0675_bin_7]MYK86839.1 hypothetical protein [Synechococcus sp. SB0669_bin_7]
MESFEKQLADLDLFNHRQLVLLIHGMKHPGFRYSIRSHQTSHKVSYQTACTDLLTLADHVSCWSVANGAGNSCFRRRLIWASNCEGSRGSPNDQKVKKPGS